MARPAVFLDEPAGSCTTHEESFISRGDQEGEMSFIKGVGTEMYFPAHGDQEKEMIFIKGVVTEM